MDPEDQSQAIEVRVPSRTAKILDRRAEAAERRGRWKKRFAVLLVFLLGATASWIVGEFQRERERSDYQWIVNLYTARVLLLEQNLSQLRREGDYRALLAKHALGCLHSGSNLAHSLVWARRSCREMVEDYWSQKDLTEIEFSLPRWGDSPNLRDRANAVEVLRKVTLTGQKQPWNGTLPGMALRSGDMMCAEIKVSAQRAIILVSLLTPFIEALSDPDPSNCYAAVKREIGKLYDRVLAAAIARYFFFWSDDSLTTEELKLELGDHFAEGDIIIASKEDVAPELAALHSEIDESLQKILVSIDGVSESDPRAIQWQAIGELLRKLAYDQKSELYYRKSYY